MLQQKIQNLSRRLDRLNSDHQKFKQIFKKLQSIPSGSTENRRPLGSSQYDRPPVENNILAEAPAPLTREEASLDDEQRSGLSEEAILKNKDALLENKREELQAAYNAIIWSSDATARNEFLRKWKVIGGRRQPGSDRGEHTILDEDTTRIDNVDFWCVPCPDIEPDIYFVLLGSNQVRSLSSSSADDGRPVRQLVAGVFKLHNAEGIDFRKPAIAIREQSAFKVAYPGELTLPISSR